MTILLEVARTRRILQLGLPIVSGMSKELPLELVDIVFAGHLGTVALAVVGD